MKNVKTNKGITLIALVVTIIVLLILAAVTIGLVLGQNGIIGKANQAKTITPQKEAEEAIKLVLGEWQIEKYTGTMTLKEFLESKVPDELDSVKGEEAPFEVEKNGYISIVNDNGDLNGEIMQLKYRPKVTAKLAKDTTGNSVDENVENGTKLYIIIDAEVEEGKISNIETYKTEPKIIRVEGTNNIFEITGNGTYEFMVTANEGETYMSMVIYKYVVDVYSNPTLVSLYNKGILKVGDFINYDAGTWKKEEVNYVKTFNGETIDENDENPSINVIKKNGQFGQISTRYSKNNSITPEGEGWDYVKYYNNYNGWRVLKIDGENIVIIHAGTPEAFCIQDSYGGATEDYQGMKILYGKSSNDSIDNNDSIVPRDWRMYENEMAVEGSSRIFSKEMRSGVPGDVLACGAWYWLGGYATPGPTLVYASNENGNTDYAWYNVPAIYGVRPVVTLKSNLMTSGQKEEVVGTDGITTAMVWQIIEP